MNEILVGQWRQDPSGKTIVYIVERGSTLFHALIYTRSIPNGDQWYTAETMRQLFPKPINFDTIVLMVLNELRKPGLKMRNCIAELIENT